MQKFGEIFKKFRESRGIRLKDVAKAGISTSQLSRFEKGQTDLTITKFMLILDEINMPIDEFMLSGESYYTKQDLTDLTDYLFSVEYWGYYELLLFANTSDVLNHETLMVLAKEMVRRSDFYKEIPNNRRMISTMLLNVYITCIERGELIDALYFEKQLNQCFFIETEIYERLVFQYAQNYYQYKKEGSNQSIIEMKKCIDAMKLAGSEHIAKTYEAHLKKLI